MSEKSSINISDIRQTYDVALLQRVAEEAADKAVKRTLLAIGINVDDPTEAQADMLFLREWREAAKAIRRQSIITIIGTLTVGILGLVWWALRH